MSYYAFYFGVQGSLERTGFSFGVSAFLLGFGEFTGYLTGARFIPKMHRRKMLVISNLVTAGVALLFMS